MIIFKFHFLYWVMAFICSFCGLFKNFLYFSMLIIIHEFGHFIGAKIVKWRVKKIIILPFGGITIFDEFLSKSLDEEFIILLLGPLFQILFYILFNSIFGFNLLLHNYHYSLLLFNILPIFPLDGYKLLNIFINKFCSFKISHLLTITISSITAIFVFIISLYHTNFIMLLALIFLTIKNIEEFINHNLLFNKFLLERYLYTINLKKTKIIKSNNFKKMMRECKHIFYYNNNYQTEKSFLKKKFDIKNKLC
ncbi:MAG: hypothetical protein HFI86_07770 [Bacilli bacterium]|nr:hypothetical protein [Bacilli bacterium]